MSPTGRAGRPETGRKTRPIVRRSLLAGGMVAVAALAVRARTATTDGTIRSLRADPFQLGVASGDPTPDGAVLWTRLALDPMAEDGQGGMPSVPIEIEWEVATDPQFQHVEQHDSVLAVPELGHSVHVELVGLQPGRRYHYRFRSRTNPTYMSQSGSFMTAPSNEHLGNLDFAVASCAHYQHGYFHAYESIANDQPDLVFFLGDYIYENANPPQDGMGSVRLYEPEDVRADTLALFRRRYAQHHVDPQLQAAHAASAWVPVFDDHEVHNDFDRLDLPSERAAAGFQAWYENMPVRIAQKPDGSSIRIHRDLRWGSLAEFHMLDTRQFRDPVATSCEGKQAPDRTIAGDDQIQWLLDGFAASDTRWDILAQQVFFAQRMRSADPCDINEDKWDGFQADRNRVVQGWQDAQIRNPVVLTGDHHRHFAGNVSTTFGIDDPVGAELVCSSVTSRGANVDGEAGAVQYNPNLKYGADKRGYIRCQLTPDLLTAEFVVVSDVRNPSFEEQDVLVDAVFVVEDGSPGIESA